VLGITALRVLGLEQMKMLAYSRIADDGASWYGVLEVSNVNDARGLLSMGPLVAAVLYPAFNKAREKARKTSSVSNLRQLALATIMYSQDHNEILPPLKTPEDIKRILELDDKICSQPSSKLPYLPNPNIAARALGVFNDADTVILFYEQTPYADGGRCVAFLDGHVAYVTAKDWGAMKAKAGIR